ncbi:cyanophycin metabolism-associated DUF1854 family protein [Schlesneria sp.]|uniref:cyanophycin metabolism-associated DUF1854 family protein n=1 Tax=Schlesneria sp. TaxID=2762018 RepID=UPI002F0E048C
MTDLTKLTFDHDSWGRLTLTLDDGRTYAGIDPLRCFPLTDPEKLIALLDSEGHEILTLPDLDALSPQSRDVLKAELAARDFVPVIQRVISTTNPSPPCHWVVDTDRGRTRFQLESEDDVRKLGTHRVIVADSHGIRYSIPDVRRLDSHSQRIVQRLA